MRELDKYVTITKTCKDTSKPEIILIDRSIELLEPDYYHKGTVNELLSFGDNFTLQSNFSIFEFKFN